MSTAETFVRLGLALAEIRDSARIANERADMAYRDAERGAAVTFDISHNRGLAYAYERSAQEIEAAIGIGVST